MNTPTLKPDSKYLFEFINREDGRKTKAVIATPNSVIHWLETQEQIKPEDLYVNFLMDIGAANECKPDETLAMSDLVMSVPLFSGKAFITIFKEPESYARFIHDLHRYDENITDADFPTVEGEDNGEA